MIDPEFLIHRLAPRLAGQRHIAVGAMSPIPAAAALLARHRDPAIRVTLLGSRRYSAFTDGGRELFDCAAQGRIDTFFLGGVQIDGQGNINLIGTGRYPALDTRFSGSFGSAYLYPLVSTVVLFCWSHSVRTLVKQVDFISAAGPSVDEAGRERSPALLITDRCTFDFDRTQRRFRLQALHPGQTLDSVRENTGFDFDVTTAPHQAELPDDAQRAELRAVLRGRMQPDYPDFVARVWP